MFLVENLGLHICVACTEDEFQQLRARKGERVAVSYVKISSKLKVVGCNW